MSVKALAWAYRQTTLHPYEKLILLFLADVEMGHEEYSEFPPNKSIQSYANLSETQIKTALSSLRDQGFIDILHKENSVTYFRIGLRHG